MNNNQLKLIWGLAKKINYDAETLHGLIWDDFGKRSLKELNLIQTQQLVDKLKQFAGDEVRKDYHTTIIKVDDQGNLIHYASPAQIYQIKFLARKLRYNTDHALFQFIKNRFDVSVTNLEDLTVFYARSVILSFKTTYQNRLEKSKSLDSQKSLL